MTPMPEHQPQADRTRATLPGSSSLSAEAAALFDLLVDREEPIKQLDAGHLLGLDGHPSTVRREVQHCRDDLLDAGIPVCTGNDGMWIAESEEEQERYYRRLLAHGYSTLEKARKFKQVSRRQLIRDLFERDRQDDNGTSQGERGGDCRVSRVGDDSGAESAECDHCGEPFSPPPGRAHLTLYCSSTCRYRAANERRLFE